MGADWEIESPPRSNLQTRGDFYRRLTAADRPPVDCIAGLEHLGAVGSFNSGAAGGFVHVEVPVPPDAGNGYFSLTQVGTGLLVIVDDYSLQKPREEIIPDGGLIELFFRLSGELALARAGSATVRLTGPGLFMVAHPPASTTTRMVAASRERGVTLVVTPRFLEDEFLNPCAPTGAPLRELTSRRIPFPKFSRVTLSSIMLQAVTRLLENRHFGKLSFLHTEGVARELLCAAMSPLATTAAARLKTCMSSCTEGATRH